jgi:hypothetical protein
VITTRPGSRRRRQANSELTHAISAQHLDALATAKRRARGHPGVTGVDFGYIYKSGVRTGDIGIRYHVPKKLPKRAIAAEHHLPEHIDSIEVDVVEAGYKPHRADPFAPAAVLQPGLSIGNVPRQADGTLGMFVTDRQDKARCVLSNWHVLCGGAQAQVGDEISQPGPLFLGSNQPRQIAQLRRWISPERQYDAAIAALSDGLQVDATLLDSSIQFTSLTEPRVGMTVVKSGAATGFTHALIDAVGGSYRVPYGEFGDTDRWMLGVRLVPHSGFHDRDVSLPGDSGSIWVEMGSGNAVALNFAGEDDAGPLNEYALAHSLSELCSLLDIEI